VPRHLSDSKGRWARAATSLELDAPGIRHTGISQPSHHSSPQHTSERGISRHTERLNTLSNSESGFRPRIKTRVQIWDFNFEDSESSPIHHQIFITVVQSRSKVKSAIIISELPTPGNLPALPPYVFPRSILLVRSSGQCNQPSRVQYCTHAPCVSLCVC
jgi:hypothetical protein